MLCLMAAFLSSSEPSRAAGDDVHLLAARTLPGHVGPAAELQPARPLGVGPWFGIKAKAPIDPT